MKSTKAIIGLCMSNPENLTRALALGLLPDAFEENKEREIFRAMMLAEKEGRGFGLEDLGTVLPQRIVELADILTESPLATNIGYYVKAAMSCLWRTRAMTQIKQLAAMIQSADEFETTDIIQERVTLALENLSGITPATSSFRDVVPVSDSFIDQMERDIKDREAGKAIGVDTGFAKLNAALGGGLRRGRLLSLSARSGKGKTTLALSMARSALYAGSKVLFSSIEASAEELLQRILANDGSIDGTRMLAVDFFDGDLDRLQISLERMREKGLTFDDSFGGDINRFETTVRRLHRLGKVEVVFLDYIQQCFDPEFLKMGKPQMLAQVTGRLKRLAMELNISIVILSQLNRNVDKVDDFPVLADIADSSAIEKDSDFALILHWVEDSCKSLQPVLRLCKNRIGPAEMSLQLAANLAMGRFTQLGG